MNTLHRWVSNSKHWKNYREQYLKVFGQILCQTFLILELDSSVMILYRFRRKIEKNCSQIQMLSNFPFCCWIVTRMQDCMSFSFSGSCELPEYLASSQKF